MKLGNSLLALACHFAPAAGYGSFHRELAGSSSNMVGNSMWIFSSDGVSIFSADGSPLKSMNADEVCHDYTGRSGGISKRCDFYDVASDGKQYVYAAVTRGVAKIDVFDIDTGSLVGSYATCGSPRGLEYHPIRDELWVRCEDPDADGSYMDVFSASGLSSNRMTNISLASDGVGSRGYTVIDNTLGDVGYTTDRNQPYLFKIDLSEKKIANRTELPGVAGGYEVAYSPVNKHIFIRSTVCCTCGFEGADKGPDCGRYGGDNVTVTTGPWANPDKLQSGQCGHRCDGVKAVDNVGVYEYDTTNDTIVASHTLDDGSAGDPYSSPDGKYVLMFGHNGGTSIRVLKAGEPGMKSTVYADLVLGFNTSGVMDDNVYDDFAFVKRGEMDIAVFGSSTENKLAIVDFSADPPTTSKITLTDKVKEDGFWERRQVEWAVDTDYVWVEGSEYNEVYVVDIVKKIVVKTITGVDPRKMVSVNNVQREQQAAMVQNMISEASVKQAAAAGSMGSMSSTTSSLEAGNEKDSSNSANMMGAIALFFGVVAFVLGAMNLYLISRVNNPALKANNGAAPVGDDEVVTLGSKEAV